MKYLFIWLIRFYQKAISPLKPPCCRFTPSCSAYALEAFQKRGFFVGFALTVWRILRCNPFCMGGYNPVPEKGFDHYPVRVPKYANGQEHRSKEAPDDPGEADSDSDVNRNDGETDR